MGEQVPVWVSKNGVVETIDPNFRKGYYSLPALSPEGDRLAVTLNESGESHIWIKQLDEGPMSKLTFQGSQNTSAAWHPDGDGVAFVSSRGSDLASTDIYLRESDGSGQSQLLLDTQGPIGEVTYSPDGEWVIFRGGSEVPSDIYGKRVGSNEEPINLSDNFAGAGNYESNASVSPDGKWLVYQSNESGRWEVYVHPFPNIDDARWQVSTQGGRTPVWAHSGHELYFVSLLDSRLMAVPITEGTTFIHGEPVELFVIQGLERAGGNIPFYDVMPGDERFIMVLNADSSGRLVFVENFLEELIQRAGN
jgi:Tol biopolymer transport system component